MPYPTQLINFDPPTENQYLGTTYWMQGTGTLLFTANRANQPLGFAWKLYLTHPQQSVSVVLNGQQVGGIPASDLRNWTLTQGSLLLKARKGVNTLELRPSIVGSAATPIDDVPDGRSLLIVHLTLNDLKAARKEPSPAEVGSSVVLALALTALFAWMLGFYRRRSYA